MRGMVSVVAAALISAGCWNPFSPSREGHFTWTAGSQQYRATEDGLGALRNSSGVLFISGVDCDGGGGMGLSIEGNPGAGTHTGETLYASFSLDSAGSTTYEVRSGVGSGFVTLSSITGDRATGSFSLSMVRQQGSGAAGVSVQVDGTFDVPFHDNPIC